MQTLTLKAAVVLTAAFVLFGCHASRTGRSSPPDVPQIHTAAASDGSGTLIEVVGLSSATLRSLRKRPPGPEEWPALLRISITGAEALGLPAVLGAYSVTDDAIRFKSTYPLDPGRAYHVIFKPSRLPRPSGERPATTASKIEATVNAPGIDGGQGQPATRVVGVYPSGDVLPENALRMYIFFSAPMDRAPRADWIRLLDDAGRPVDSPFLPLDVGLWNGERTRFTVLFDPGRVKKGVLPNEQLGRSIRRGQRYTLVIDREWRDAHGQPLVDAYRRAFRVSDPIEAPIDPSRWRLDPPARAGTRDPLAVSFPAALDYALMQRAIGVQDAHGSTIGGAVAVDRGETLWRFVPDMPWTEGAYSLVAQSILEDPAGNRIGRPFELVNAAPAPISQDGHPTMIPFRVQ